MQNKTRKESRMMHTTLKRKFASLYTAILVSLMALEDAKSWRMVRYQARPFRTLLRETPSANLDAPRQQRFTEIIQEAASKEGCSKVTVDWKASRLVVTIHDTMYVHDDQAVDDEELDDEISPEEAETPTIPSNAINIVVVSRAIRNALDSSSTLLEQFELEVTTPGVPSSNELVGDVMFKSYRGFDVVVEAFVKPKKKIDNVDSSPKIKIREGRLVERTEDYTMINIKGRMQKIPNDTIVSVKLPKAKKEKR